MMGLMKINGIKDRGIMIDLVFAIVLIVSKVNFNRCIVEAKNSKSKADIFYHE